jgi:chromosomal replication initiation ATPase DnaA
VRAYLWRHSIPIEEDVLAYLLSRVVREQAQLLALLQSLCERVLVSGQRPTRPMLRELLISPDQLNRRK